MKFVVHVTPNYTENALRFLSKLVATAGIRPALISMEPFEWLPIELRSSLISFRQVRDVFDSAELIAAAKSLADEFGAIHRITSATEQVQIPVARVRDALKIKGMGEETMLNFRDKSRMKNLLRAAGLPVARHFQAENEAQARDFCEKNGFPVVAKPLDGAASISTFKIENEQDLVNVLAELQPTKEKPLLLEEFILGDEFSFDTFLVEGKPVFHSLTMYLPNPLHAVRNPWIQWQVVLPIEIDDPKYDDIRAANAKTLEVLGMKTGMTHLEWFRRNDGTIAISEVAARPPGAQITTMISRHCDFDSEAAWFRLMYFNEFPTDLTRKYAVGAAFLRGMGEGRVKEVRGLDKVVQDFGHLICDRRIPQIGQEKAKTYEGEGFIILRHPETEVAREALSRVVADVKVILG